jgi:hypothetical protein
LALSPEVSPPHIGHLKGLFGYLRIPAHFSLSPIYFEAPPLFDLLILNSGGA